MNGIFNEHILVDKLSKLNSSQKSIETLSHWCIFHRRSAKQVVETWERQFHCSPKEQRLSFLYLANDILQNSRRNGLEFVGEFWRVLPDALRDVIGNGDQLEKNSVLRLINIWDDRKVFGSRGQTLKEELIGKSVDNNDNNNNSNNSQSKNLGIKLKQPLQATVEKIISSYENAYGSPVDEETLLSKCRTVIDCIEKAEKEIGGDYSSVQFNGPKYVELQGQRDVLTECIDKLKVVESSRARLVYHLREALQEQELKLSQVKNQLQVVESQSAHVSNICQKLLNGDRGPMIAEQREVKAHAKDLSSFTSEIPATGGGGMEQSASLLFTREDSFLNKRSYSFPFEQDPSTAKFSASTSSAQMLSHVFSLESETVAVNPREEYSDPLPFEKRTKLETLPFSYFPPPHPRPPPPLPPFPHPDALHNKPAPASQQIMPRVPAPPPLPPPPPPPPPLPQSPPPPLPPLPPPYMQTAGSMIGGPYSYRTFVQPSPPTPPPPGFSMPLPTYLSPPVPYQQYQAALEGGFFSQPPIPATPPISRS